MPDLGSERPDLGARKPDLGSKRVNLGSERPDLGSEKGLGACLRLGGTYTGNWKKIALHGIIGKQVAKGQHMVSDTIALLCLIVKQGSGTRGISFVHPSVCLSVCPFHPSVHPFPPGPQARNLP